MDRSTWQTGSAAFCRQQKEHLPLQIVNPEVIAHEESPAVPCPRNSVLQNDVGRDMRSRLSDVPLSIVSFARSVSQVADKIPRTTTFARVLGDNAGTGDVWRLDCPPRLIALLV